MRHHDGLGGHIDILQQGGDDEPMRFRMVMPKGFGPPAPERHPNMREDFRVLRGTLDLGMVDGKRVVLHAGDSFTLPAGCYHKPANGGDDELEFEATLTPGRSAATMFAELYTETREHSGFGQFVRVAMTFRRHAAIISFPLPLRVMMTLVTAVARLLGVRPTPVELPATTTANELAPAAAR